MSIFRTTTLAACLSVLAAVSLPAAAHAATLYYDNRAGDGEWTHLSSWWQNSGLTVQATQLPGPSDDVFIKGDVITNANNPASVHSADFSTGVHWDPNNNGLELDVSNGIVLHDTSVINSGTIFGNATLFGNSDFGDPAELTGDITLHDSSGLEGVIHGNVTFDHLNTVGSDGDSVDGTVKYTNFTGGVITIPDGANWAGPCGSSCIGNDNNPITTWVFDGGGTNSSGIPGNATFNATSSNAGGEVSGNATFNDSSTNLSGSVGGDATFNDSSSDSSGNIIGQGFFYDKSLNFNEGTVNDATFCNDSRDDGSGFFGTFNTGCTLYFYATTSTDWTNLSNWWLDAGHTSPSSHWGGAGDFITVVPGSLQPSVDAGEENFDNNYFANGSVDAGAVGLELHGGEFLNIIVTTGTTTINNSSFNGTVYNGIFNNSILTDGVSNNAIFNGTSFNDEGGVNGASIWNDTSHNGNGSDGAVISGPATFNDNSYNASDGTVNADAIFNDSSHNDGAIGGKCDFYGTSDNSGSCNGGGSTFSDSSTNHGSLDDFSTIFFGDLSQNISGSASGPTREYTVDTATVRNFVTDFDAPWTVIASSSRVDVTGATYDGSTVFQATGSGCFVGGPSPVCSVVSAPTVATTPADTVTASSANLNGAIASTGGADASDRGFIYSTHSDLSSHATTSLGAQTGTGAFASVLSSLSCATAYYFAAYATNSAGTAYGSTQSFTTSACPSSGGGGGGSSSSSGGSVSSWILQTLFGRPTPPVPGCPSGFTCTPATTTPPAAYSFPRSLTQGERGNDVLMLQEYLNTHGFQISSSGPGSPGRETVLFGLLTKAALIRFQKAHGIPATGFFGPITRGYVGGHN